MEKEDENCVPILIDKNGKRIEETFYTDKSSKSPGLAYVSFDRQVYIWVIERHYEKPEDSAYLTPDNARSLEKVVNSAGLFKQLKIDQQKSEIEFMRRKASEFLLK